MGESDVYGSGSTTAQETSQSPEAVSPDGVQFDHAALLVGRSLYWAASPQQHVAGLEKLIRWCLSLPGARLGISISDAATIVRDVFAVSPRAPSPAEQAVLDRFSGSIRSAIQWPPDREVWEPHLEKLLGWMDQASKVSDYAWLDPEDADWWITAAMRSIASCNSLFRSSVDSGAIFRLISRQDCAVFAPFEGGATLDRLIQLIGGLPPERQLHFATLLADARLDRERLAEVHDIFWSWRLIDFADVDGSIVCTPLLTMWSEWPSSAQWAYPSLASVAPRRQYTGEEVAFLLEDTFWQRLETLLSTARNACGLGVAEPEFAGVESRPPLFYFAAPADPPIRPEGYAGSLRPSIMPLVRSCLLSSDPLAEQVAWGLVEGDLVALRREVSRRQSYQPRYLLLPTSTRSPSARPIEENLGAVADRLTYLEFSIGHEARDVYTDMEPLAVRRAMWGGTLDSVNTVTGEALDLLPAAHKSHTGRIMERLASLHMLLRRLQASIETAASDANQVEGKYNSYLDSTDDFLRRTMTTSTVTALDLPAAIERAYPYQYVKQPLESLQSNMRQLSSSVDRISASLNTILDLSDRRLRDLSSRLSGIFNFIIALLALLVGLAQVIGAQSGASTSSASSAPTGFLGRIAQISQVNVGARFLFEVVGLLLIAMFVVYVVVWVIQRLPRRRHKFVLDMQRFRACAGAAEDSVARVRASEQNDQDATWRQLDRLDDEAVQILAGLWKELQRAQEEIERRNARVLERFTGRVHVRGVREWERRARRVEHSIELFDLSPRIILLPRTLCVLRLKSTDFRTRTMVSDWDFSASLRAMDYTQGQIDSLESWLSLLPNQRQIQEWDVTAFARTLKAHGVTAVPSDRKPDRWQGTLDGASA